MNITIISCFRNATGHIERYFDQVGKLSTLLAARGDWLKLILGYGDSTDGTGEMLFEEATFCIDALLVDVSHGGPVYSSVEDAQRFKQLAFVGNRLLGYVSPQTDVVGFVESDLIWDAQTLVRLIDHLAHVPAVAPMIMDGEHSFYDVYAYRRNGERFTKQPPFHPELNGELLQVDSAGSVLFVRGDYARKARLSDGEAIVGFCKQIVWHGGSIYCDPQASVQHPSHT